MLGVVIMAKKFVVVDLETTGNTHGRGDRIIQISAVVIENYKIIHQYTSFINPGVEIPPFIEELTGINDEMVADAPDFSEIAPKIYKLLLDSVFVAHNVPFDLGFLKNELSEVGLPLANIETVDTVELAKIMLPEAQSYKLSDLSELVGVQHENPHQADSDALVTAELLLLLINKARKLPLVTLEKLSALAYYLKSDIDSLFTKIVMDKRRTIDDLQEELEVFRGIAIRKKQVPEIPIFTQKVSFPKTKKEKQLLFDNSNNRLLLRDGQISMMDTVNEAFTTNKHAIIEAGTGIGKSLAYLIPALYFAVENKQPVIISTYTIQMQDQLLYKELERIKNIVPFSFRATVFKGRRNYINMLKFEHSLSEVDHHYDTVLTKMQILVWLVQTETGDLDELNFSSGGQIYRLRVEHDGWFYSQEKDPWKSRDFYLHARNQATNADIVITNHAMLLADAEKDGEILPHYQYMIIDEAHNFEKAARKCFGKKLEYNSVKFWLGRLGSLEKKQLLYKFEELIVQRKLKPKIPSEKIENALSQLEVELDDFFLILGKLLYNSVHNGKLTTKHQLRITKKILESRSWQALQMCAERVYDFHRCILRGLDNRLQLLKEQYKELSESERAFLEEVNSFMKKWQLFGDTLKTLIIRPEEKEVVWVEGDIRALPNSISMFGQPLNLATVLSDGFFTKKNSVVMTSATLTVNSSFHFFVNEIGLNNDSAIKKIIQSPFDYKNIAKLMIPTDLPEVRGTVDDQYIEEISNHLIAIADATEGRMLVLFTSYDMLRKTYNLVKESEALEDFVLLGQGITAGSRTRLTRSFQQFNKAILFGTSSFWEGIDIPGKDLSCLVIVRLPFSPPDDPVISAKYEEIKEAGKNPFSTHSLPEAVIRFKQGFGRLIRGDTDRGIAIVFDRRIDTTTYGKAFLRSIPPVQVERGEIRDIIKAINEWL